MSYTVHILIILVCIFGLWGGAVWIVESASRIAKKLGLSDVLASNNGTGFVVLVDGKNKDEKALLTTKQSADEMLKVVEKNLLP